MARNRYYEDEKTKKLSKSQLRHALKFVIPYRKLLSVLFVLMILITFISMLPPMINGLIVDNVIPKKTVLGMDYKTLSVVLIAAYVLAVVTDTVFSYFRQFYMTKVGHSIVHDIRYATYEHLQKLAFDFYDSRPNGKILVRVTSYLDELANVFSSSIIMLILDAVKVIAILIWMCVIGSWLTLIMLAAVIPMLVLVNLIRRSLEKRRRAYREKRSNRIAYIAENIQGSSVTNAFNRNERNIEIYDGLNKEERKKWCAVTHVNELHFPTMSGFFYIGIIAVYAVVVYMAVNKLGLGGLTPGSVISFISYAGMLSAPLNEIATYLQEISSAVSNLESVMDILEVEPTVVDDENAQTLPPVQGDVKFENVYFSYENAHIILENINFEVPKGKMVALVGPTGSGKTTIVSLLSRFYNVDSGTIYVDGHDISKVTLYSLRKQIGVMMQDSFIFSGTIIDNIRYGKPDATDEQCIEAAKQVGADAFISKLPDGYYTKTIEQGSRLSTGERQLISFARVLLTDPKILILDEATASIDTETENLIKDALNVILDGRTSFVIAHRLSTIEKADCIFYIANHTIAEAGTHAQLMAKKGYYYELVNHDAKDDRSDS
ncbi:MAG: ABC transporter ATP-binding protein [Firmicutes bacterium]|nr:ABC transporter ATP-binding protein [Bacillota bacterium]